MARKSGPRGVRGYDPKLNPDLIVGSIDNAKRLLGDAEVLEAKGSYGPAASLTVVALEEMGKALALKLGSQMSEKLGWDKPSEPGEVVESTAYTNVFDSHSTKKYILFSVVPALGTWYSRQPSAPPEDFDAAKFAGVIDMAMRASAGDPKVYAEHGTHGGFQALMSWLPQWFTQIEAAARQYEIFRQRGLYVDVVDNAVLKPSDLDADQIRPIRAFARGALGIVDRVLREGFPPEYMDLLAAWVEKHGSTPAEEVDRSNVPPPPGGWEAFDRMRRDLRRPNHPRSKPRSQLS